MNFQSIQAQVVFFLWPLVVFYIFQRFPIAQAAAYSFFCGIMFLPESAWIKPPLFPVLDKYSLTYVSMLLAMLAAPRKARGHTEPWIWMAFFGSFMSGIMVWVTNEEPLLYGPTVVTGLSFMDGMFLSVLSMIGTPLVALLGMKCFRDERDLNKLVLTFCRLGLINGVFALIEVKMSPILHARVYGYDNNNFLMMMRHGGYRPQGLLSGGLAFAIFLLGVLIVACVLSRYRMTVWVVPGKLAMWFMLIVVILAKSTAVWVYAIAAVPIVLRSSAKTISRWAVVLVLLVCAYPAMRATGTFPTDKLLEFAGNFGTERVESMEFRFRNEDTLLKHAMEKPWFGWSLNYGRNQVYDAISGTCETVTDGGWIIALGAGGITGIVGYFAVPVGTVLIVARRLKKIADKRAQTMLAALSLYIAFSWVDILPNGSFNLLPQFLCGAMCSISYNLANPRRQPARRPANESPMPSPTPSSAPAPVQPAA